MDLTLYAVSATGRVALGDLLKGVKYVQAEKSGDGLVTLTPVNIRAASGQTPEQATSVSEWDKSDEGEAPWE